MKKKKVFWFARKESSFVCQKKKADKVWEKAKIRENISSYRIEQKGDIIILIADKPGEKILVPIHLAGQSIVLNDQWTPLPVQTR